MSDEIIKEEEGFFDKLKHKASELADKAGGAWDSATVKAEDLWDKAKDKAEDAWDATKEKAGELKEMASEKYDEIKGNAHEVGNDTANKVGAAANIIKDKKDDLDNEVNNTSTVIKDDVVKDHDNNTHKNI